VGHKESKLTGGGPKKVNSSSNVMGIVTGFLINLAVFLPLSTGVRTYVMGTFELSPKDATFIVLLCLVFYLVGLLAMWVTITVDKKVKAHNTNNNSSKNLP